AHTGYQVNIHGYDYRELPGEVAAAVEGGDPPAVAGYYAPASQLARDTYTPAGQPYFTPAGSALSGQREVLGEPVVIGDIEPAVRDYFSYRGELLCLPLTATTTLLYSNRSLLAAAGVPGPPRTWDELEAACRAIVATGNGA